VQSHVTCHQHARVQMQASSTAPQTSYTEAVQSHVTCRKHPRVKMQASSTSTGVQGRTAIRCTAMFISQQYAPLYLQAFNALRAQASIEALH
jgi:hypothetical protein